MIARFVLLLVGIMFLPVSAFAQEQTMRPSDGPTNPMLVAGAGPHIGNQFPAQLSLRDPHLGWQLVPVGNYVAIREGGYAMAVAAPVGNGQQVAVEGYTGADTQLWRATNVIGILFTFAPKLAPQYILQTQNGALTLGTPLTVAPPTPGAGGVGVISSQMWVYPQR